MTKVPFGFPQAKFSRSFFLPSNHNCLETHDRIGSWLVSVFIVGHPNLHHVARRIINSNLRNSSGETSLPLYDQLQVKNNQESHWGQPEGHCRKEKWPRGHMWAEALRAILKWDLLTTVETVNTLYLIPAIAVLFCPWLDLLLSQSVEYWNVLIGHWAIVQGYLHEAPGTKFRQRTTKRNM